MLLALLVLLGKTSGLHWRIPLVKSTSLHASLNFGLLPRDGFKEGLGNDDERFAALLR